MFLSTLYIFHDLQYFIPLTHYHSSVHRQTQRRPMSNILLLIALAYCVYSILNRLQNTWTELVFMQFQFEEIDAIAINYLISTIWTEFAGTLPNFYHEQSNKR